jgi:hypothetical protein
MGLSPIGPPAPGRRNRKESIIIAPSAFSWTGGSLGRRACQLDGATYQQYTNAYNGSHQYNFACKHDGTLFFVATNGGDDPTTANVEAKYYRPLQQLQDDLDHDTVARYNLITPDQYNDMHSGLSTPFVYNGVTYAGDLGNIAQGDNFLSIIIPKIMASKAYKRNGVIVIWNDETIGTALELFGFITKLLATHG